MDATTLFPYAIAGGAIYLLYRQTQYTTKKRQDPVETTWVAAPNLYKDAKISNAYHSKETTSKFIGVEQDPLTGLWSRLFQTIDGQILRFYDKNNIDATAWKAQATDFTEEAQ